MRQPVMLHKPQYFKLPDTLEHWPWKRLLNPHFQEVKDESAAWLRSFKAFEPRQQRKFDLCDFSTLSLDARCSTSYIYFPDLLAGLSYSLLNKGDHPPRADSKLFVTLTDIRHYPEHLRVGCDFLNFVFVYDEFADVLDKDGAQQQADIAMDALRNPTKARPQGESIIGEIARQ
jgi:Delta6-protoilludene synthase